MGKTVLTYVALFSSILIFIGVASGDGNWNYENRLPLEKISATAPIHDKETTREWKTLATSLLSNPDGDLRIEIPTAYNLIIDSNVESPSTYAPEAFHAGAKFCNDGTDTLWNVWMNIGDFDAATPGIYPSRTHTGLTGTFSFSHEGGSVGIADASRFIRYIAPGECFNQFWLLSYPRLDDNGNSVTQGSKPEDDLWLEFDVWATADDNGTPLAADVNRTMYMRSEISAMANKIWPNGDNKVPDEYKNAIEQSLGWSIVSSSGGPDAYPGESFTLQGIWYDLGNIGHGFDNDGDFIPDRNVWMQPVGDPSVYNPDCFRLLGMYGLVIVKKNDGTELLIPFEDQLYFTHLPENNTGAVGLVFYRFAALNGPCNGNLTPYQEVASGFDNEKFNGDYGGYIPLAVSKSSEIIFEKTMDKAMLSETLPDTATFTLAYANTGSTELGTPELGLPFIIQDSIPTGTFYVSGSASLNNILPSGAGSYIVMYSTDKGITWSIDEPTATDVTDIRWLLEEKLLVSGTGNVTFKIQVPSSYNSPMLCNTGSINFGGGPSIDDDTACSLLPGDNSIGDTVWEDDGGSTGTIGNGIQEGDEAGIPNIKITLYYDANANGQLDDSDLLWGMDTTDANGMYLFADLPDGHFIVEMDRYNVISEPSYMGWGATTVTYYTVPLDTTLTRTDPVDTLTMDFGFAPALELTKTVSSPAPYYEGQELTYTLKVENYLCTTDGSTFGLGEAGEEAEGHLYWEEYNYSAGTGPNVDGIRRALPSTATPEEILTTTTTETKTGMAIDLINEYLYWVDETTDEIKRSNLTGAEVVTILDLDPSGITDPNPYRIDLDLLVGKMYWTEKGTNKIRRANLDGSAVEEVLTVTGEDLYSLVLDVVAGKLYYGTSNGVFKTTLDGVGTTTIIPNKNPNSPVDLELDLTNSKLYQTDDASGQIDIQRVNLDGSGLEDLWKGGLPKASGIALDVENDLLYFTVSGNQTKIFVSPLGGEAADPDGTADVFIDVTGDMDDIDIALVPPYMNSIFNSIYDPFTSVQPLPLRDSFPIDSLEFIVASITPDSVDISNGQLFWDDLGPLNPKDNIEVSVTFKIKKFLSNSIELFNNTASVTGATFVTGDPANNDTSNVIISVNPAGSIAGYVWSDDDGDGWQGTTGYETGELYVPQIPIVLHTCTDLAGNGSCNVAITTDTVLTDENGYYIFEGLPANIHYYVEIVEVEMSGTVSETGDPDDNPNGNANSGNGGTCGSGGSNASCDANWDNDGDWFEIGVDNWDGNSWDIENINFGYTINPTLFGNVWEDVDGDGIQKTGEEGIAGVTVELQSSGCTPSVNCPTTTTDTNGDYEFVDLDAGTTYTVILYQGTLPPSGTWEQTAENDGTINNAITDTPVGGEVSGSHNFGFTSSGTGAIGDTLFYDFNGDGLQTINEEPIPNVILSLYKDLNGNGAYDLGIDAFMDTTSTDAFGQYLFTQLPIGDFVVVVEEGASGFPTSILQTADPDEILTCTVCDAEGNGSLNNDTLLTVDFGYQPIGSGMIGDLVWLDANGDSTQVGPTEVGFPNVTVELWADLNNDGVYSLYETMETDVDGFYLFEELADGSYQVRVDSTDADIPMDGNGNVYSPSTAMTYDVIMEGGVVTHIDIVACTDCDLDMDFGFLRLGSIGDMVFWDANKNGEFDWSEEGIPYVTVYLLYSLGTIIDSTVTSDGTDGNPIGYYLFDDLYAADYTVQVKTSDPDLNGAILMADPSADGVPCDDPTAFGCDSEYTSTIGFGTNFTGADFGYVPTGVLGDYIWFDQNGDGIQGTGEPGIGGVQVVLTNQTAVTIDGVFYSVGSYKDTVYTDLDGGYIYQNLPDGIYSVDVTDPINMAITSGAESVGTLSIDVVMSGGEVSDIGGTGCSDCSLDVDFGFELSGPYSLSGNICMDDDANIDGICNGAGDTQLDSTTVYLYNDDGDFLGSTLTNSSGFYYFGNLPADTFIVAIGTTYSPFDIADLTTTVDDTPAIDLVEGAFSTYQTIPVATDVIGVDFAFQLNVDLDFGDLPDDYKTSLTLDGARHIIPALPTLYLGMSVDTEGDGQPSFDAKGDGADEQGVVFIDADEWTAGTVTSGNGGSLQVSVVGDGYLVGWIDFDKDFSLANDVVVDTSLTTGAHTLTFDIPSGTIITDVNFYARFRYFPHAPPFTAFAYTGIADDGEVEDYYIFTSAAPCISNCPPVKLVRFKKNE